MSHIGFIPLLFPFVRFSLLFLEAVLFIDTAAPHTHLEALGFLIEVDVVDMLDVGGQGDVVGQRLVASPLDKGRQLATNGLRGDGKRPQSARRHNRIGGGTGMEAKTV